MKKFHYTYLITDLNPTGTEKYYIGVRSCNCPPSEDSYMGTPTSRRSLEFQDRLKECPGEFDKIVIGIYTTRNDAESAECDMLQSYHVTDNNLFYNVFSGNITSNGLLK